MKISFSVFLLFSFFSVCFIGNTFAAGSKNKNCEELFLQIERYQHTNPDSSIYFSKQLQQLSRHKFPVYYAKALYGEARAIIIKGKYREAILLLQKADAIFRKYGKKAELAKSFNLYAVIFLKLEDYEKGLEYFKKSYQMFLQLGDSSGIPTAATNIFLVYCGMNNLSEAKKYLMIQEKYEDSTSNNAFYLYNNYCRYHMLANDYPKALKFAEKCLATAERFKMQDSYLTAKLNLGIVLFHLKNYVRAERELNEALELAIEERNLPDQQQILVVLIDLYAKQKKYEAGFEKSQYLAAVNDSLNIRENNMFMHKAENKLRLSEKEKLIAKQKNRLLTAQINQEQSNKKLLASAMFLLGLVVITFFVMSNYYKIKRKNTIISVQKDEMESQKNELRDLHQLNQKIFAIISHDFRGPIDSLEILVSLLIKNEKNPAFLKELLPDVKNQLTQSRLVLENLINFAKAEMEQPVKTASETRVRSVIESIVETFHSEIESKKIRIENEVAADYSVGISRDLLLIVCRNLISNAIKYSHSGGVIRIFIQDNDQLVVEDFGVGISSELKKQLFKQHVVSESGTDYETGFGLGLKISSELMERVGASVQLGEKEEKGSKFILRFT